MQPTQLTEKNDIKIFILYLLNNINQPMEYADINDIVVQDGIVGPIDFAECFAELLDSGNVIEIVENSKSYYMSDFIQKRRKQYRDELQIAC